jgi:hypothetical protein
MPTYTFRDTNTGEVFDKWMYMAERQPFLEANPNLVQMPSMPNVVSGVGTDSKIDGGFKEVMNKVQKAHPRANLSRFT